MPHTNLGTTHHYIMLPLAFVLGALLTACGGGNDGSQPSPPPPSPSGGWVFQFSPGMSVSPFGNGGFSFTFPTQDGVHYLVKPQNTALSQSISVSYNIDAPPNTIFDYRTNPNNTCGPGYPGTVTPYFHKSNDPTFADEFGRWFGSGFKVELIGGSFSVLAQFYSDPSQWVSVYGKNGSEYLTQFQQALASVAEVGVVFGGGCFAGHGVFISAGGPASMNASSFLAQ